MTLEECYIALHGNYAEAKSRLMTDTLIERVVLKFTSDPSMQQLLDAVAAGAYADAFRAVHTLKGVAANMGFTELQQHASALTEQVRSCDVAADPALLEAVKESYKLVMDTIEAYNLQK